MFLSKWKEVLILDWGEGVRGGCEGGGKAPGNTRALSDLYNPQGHGHRSLHKSTFRETEKEGRKRVPQSASPLPFSAVSLCFTQEISGNPPHFASRGEVWAAPPPSYSPLLRSLHWLGSWGRRKQEGRYRGAVI